jgi:hypothetical protein
MRYTLITCDGTVEVAKIDEWWNKLTNRKAAE